MRRLALALLCSSLLVAAYAPPAAATATRVAVTGYEVLDTWLEEGTGNWNGPPVEFLGMEMPGTVEVQRGIVLRMKTFSTSAYLTGLDTYSFHHQLNYATWRGGGEGTARIEPTAHPDGWFDCAYNLQYSGVFPPGAPNWTGNLVCDGGGSLAGMKARLDLAFEAFLWKITFEGYLLVPGE